jgi:pimeloyl-ACP methyl ester carboxylesterase
MQTATPKPSKSGHAAVNGVNYYYAIYGTGEPPLLLHGGLGQIEMFGPNLTKFAQSRQVIGVDLQGHGRTSLGDREISLVDMGNDMAGVLKKLGYDKVDVLGYSMGGGVAFQFAAQHPEMVRRLAPVSAGYAGMADGWRRGMRARYSCELPSFGGAAGPPLVSSDQRARTAAGACRFSCGSPGKGAMFMPSSEQSDHVWGSYHEKKSDRVFAWFSAVDECRLVAGGQGRRNAAGCRRPRANVAQITTDK